jgi:hypothetical protein
MPRSSTSTGLAWAPRKKEAAMARAVKDFMMTIEKMDLEEESKSR